MRTFIRPSKSVVRPPRRPARSAEYDHRFWGEAPRQDAPDEKTYWGQTRRPLPCLVFILPILLLYEVGVAWLGGPNEASLRTGADVWLRQALALLGQRDRGFLPMLLVGSLLAWQAMAPRDWRFRPVCLAGMALESVVLAVGLIGLSRLVDLGFVRLEHSAPVLAASPAFGPILGFLGAGLYEEAIFRLAMIPAILGLLRLLQTPRLAAQTLAVTGSALAFSLAHHAGLPGEAFTWYAFIFRWAAGVFFAWVFLARGFGIAVGTHEVYDILVGGLGWSA